MESATNEADPEFKEYDGYLLVISSLKKPKEQRNKGSFVIPTPPRMTRSQTTRLTGESSQPQIIEEKEVILKTPPNKKHSKTLDQMVIVHEQSVENNELHGDLKIAKIVEEIQSSSFPINESLGEKLVDELIGVDRSTGKEKRIDVIKRKIREMAVVYEFIKNKNILLKYFRVRFQEEISRLKKERKSSLRKAR